MLKTRIMMNFPVMRPKGKYDAYHKMFKIKPGYKGNVTYHFKAIILLSGEKF